MLADERAVPMWRGLRWLGSGSPLGLSEWSTACELRARAALKFPHSARLDGSLPASYKHEPL
jgi:hypothetical protein